MTPKSKLDINNYGQIKSDEFTFEISESLNRWLQKESAAKSHQHCNFPIFSYDSLFKKQGFEFALQPSLIYRGLGPSHEKELMRFSSTHPHVASLLLPFINKLKLKNIN